MSKSELNITILQPNIIWENKQANLEQYEGMIASAKEKKEVVVLPEMFSTGFCMNPETLAESMDGASVNWMKQTAAQHKCILAGSLIIEEEGKFFNRFVWMQPDSVSYHYDKRHLFAYTGEDEKYTAGENRLIVSVKGWKICLMICYDLRFPVWSRNQPDGAYDILIYAANWPARRSLAWRTLLQARAIENMCYVVGANRVGMDDNNIQYCGDTLVFGPLGETLLHKENEASIATITLDKDHLLKTRTDLPFLRDADRFVIL